MIRTLTLAALLAACNEPTAPEQCEAVLAAYCDAVAACDQDLGDNCRAVIAESCVGVEDAMSDDDAGDCVADLDDVACVLRGGRRRPATSESQASCVTFYTEQDGAR